jgi:DNA-binding transcriptional MerR regulator
MLPAPPRTASGRRADGGTALRVLAFIRRSRELGFSLDEIRALLHLGAPGKASCSVVKEIAAHHPQDIRANFRSCEARTFIGENAFPVFRRQSSELPRTRYSRYSTVKITSLEPIFGRRPPPFPATRSGYSQTLSLFPVSAGRRALA